MRLRRTAFSSVGFLVLAASCSTAADTPAGAEATPPPIPLVCKADRTANPPGSGEFGCWTTDENGLAAYEYTLPPGDPRALSFTLRDRGDGSTDHWHQIGNLRLKAMVHADGRVRVFDATRGPKWVSEYSEYSVSVNGTKLPASARNRFFGMGYGRWIAQDTASGVTATRTVHAPFGARADDPTLVIEHTLVNAGAAAREVRIRELWDAEMHPLQVALTQAIRPDAADFARKEVMAQFDQAASYDTARGAILVDTRAKSATLPARSEAAPVDHYPGTFALALLDGPAEAYGFEKRAECASGSCVEAKLATTGKTTTRVGPPAFGVAPATSGATPVVRSAETSAFAPELTKTVTVPAGGTVRVRFVVAYADDAEIGNLLDTYRTAAPTAAASADAWKTAIPKLALPSSDPFDLALAREIGWHGYHLLSSANYEEYSGVHTIDQGAAYGYLMGLRSAARDWLINAVATVHLRPELAREAIMFVMMTATGERAKLSYGAGNYGELADAGIHTKPSDLDLWLLWAISEYVGATRDFDFLSTPIAYYPRTAGKSATVLARIARSLEWLTVDVGVGPHGLLKVGSGDWSDGIAFLAPNADLLHEKGESVFNTAFAAYVFPRVAALIESADAPLAARYRSLDAELRKALAASYGAAWYYRAWDGAGKPIGEDRIFLEHHAWLLIGDVPSAEQRASVLKAIEANLSKGSSIGARVVHPYIDTPIFKPGWDVNGGVWSAMNGLYVWGLSRTDPARAWKELGDNSMARHAEIYPQIWYGIWSGPDAYIAPEAERGGEAAYHLGTALVDFPVTNTNRHALPLIDVVKLAGFEYSRDGLVLKPRLPFATFALETPLAAVKYGADAVEGRTAWKTAGTLDVTLPAALASSGAAATVNGAPVASTPIDGNQGIRFAVPAGNATFRVAARP